MSLTFPEPMGKQSDHRSRASLFSPQPRSLGGQRHSVRHLRFHSRRRNGRDSSSRSTSDQVIPRTSPDRAAVRTRNSRAYFPTVVFPECRMSRTTAGISRQGTAGWCATRSRLPGCLASRRFTTSTGLAATYPLAAHHFMTASQRWRTRDAVSGLTNQMGLRHRRSARADQGKDVPLEGGDPLACMLWKTQRAALSNVGISVLARCASISVRLASSGLPPAPMLPRASYANLRAAAKLTSGYCPIPISRRFRVIGDSNARSTCAFLERMKERDIDLARCHPPWGCLPAEFAVRAR